MEHSVCGVVADEALCFWVNLEFRAEREWGGSEGDRVFAEVFCHAAERFGQFRIISDGGLDFVDGRAFSQAMGNVGDVTEGRRDVALLAFAGEG